MLPCGFRRTLTALHCTAALGKFTAEERQFPAELLSKEAVS
jgi:hypothetical protein